MYQDVIIEPQIYKYRYSLRINIYILLFLSSFVTIRFTCCAVNRSDADDRNTFLSAESFLVGRFLELTAPCASVSMW